MLNLLDRYLARSILGTIGLTMFLFLGIDLVFALVNELSNVGTGDYTLLRAGTILLLSVPQKIYQMFPMSALIGTLLGLGVLASRSELIVMQVSGVSVLRITKTIVLVAMILGGLVWALGEGLAPHLDQLSNRIKAEALSGGQTLKTSHGTWLRDGEDFVHIQKLDVGGHLEGITRYQFDDQFNLTKAIYASYGDYIDKHWVLKDINETVFDGNEVRKNNYDEMQWKSVLSPSILSVVGEKFLEKLSIAGLWRTIEYRKNNGLDERPFQLALWEKLTRPLSIAVMMFLAVPFIFGPLRSRTMGVRLLAGIIVGFCFLTFNDMFGDLALVYHLPPALGALLPTLVFLGLGLVLMRRVR